VKSGSWQWRTFVGGQGIGAADSLTGERPKAVTVLPTRIRIKVLSNGAPLAGALVMLRFKTLRNNDFTSIAGPTAADGEVIVDRDQIAREASLEKKLFPMDFGELETDFAGAVTIEPLGLEDIDRALAAFQLFKEVSPISALF
jgi:hypothetical protein